MRNDGNIHCCSYAAYQIQIKSLPCAFAVYGSQQDFPGTERFDLLGPLDWVARRIDRAGARIDLVAAKQVAFDIDGDNYGLAAKMRGNSRNQLRLMECKGIYDDLLEAQPEYRLSVFKTSYPTAIGQRHETFVGDIREKT